MLKKKKENKNYLPEDLGEIEFLRDHPKIIKRIIELSVNKSIQPFIKNSCASYDEGGFSWADTIEKETFWANILGGNNDVEYFYTKYNK